MDVKTAFLDGNIDVDVYMEQLEGFIDTKYPEKVCKLRKSIYGLKQLTRCWNKTIDNFLKKLNYTACEADPCIYVKHIGKGQKDIIIIIALYVDDLIITSNDTELLLAEKKELSRRFEIADQGEITFYLGMSINRNRVKGIIDINQTTCLENVLKWLNMFDCKPVSMECNKRFNKATENDNSFDVNIYQSAIGSLIYASIASRPDI